MKKREGLEKATKKMSLSHQRSDLATLNALSFRSKSGVNTKGRKKRYL